MYSATHETPLPTVRKGRLKRIIQMMLSFNGGKSMNAPELAEMLGVSRRTIFRDVRLLRDAGFPLMYDETAEKYFACPGLRLYYRMTACDVVRMSIALAGLHEQGFTQESELLRQLLVSALNAPLANALTEGIDTLSSEDTVSIHFVSAVELERIAPLLASKLNRKKVRLTFRNGQSTLLSLNNLTLTPTGWAVVGRSSYHRTVCEFALSEIELVVPTTDSYQLPIRPNKQVKRGIVESRVLVR